MKIGDEYVQDLKICRYRSIPSVIDFAGNQFRRKADKTKRFIVKLVTTDLII